ncbi:putative PKS-like enzyme [Aspergillus clavatus NRRL 1]|uniref:PKS-like enzyme, putative n=1 Tax=Aspergillus clavatus (strain ATCC 1007 / CBS 513.65 / DSM 816 / NCTC 3887 / NRRL 1 / QM 1276 / 107) TaxID=344612 RepID=A1C9G7_ASPCL|nr:PKS-like enzyme, putative [Aspergillus clavatus NRRL 1]EAW13491.1 PKS-like enzyme, putative [Aspergillus clavatus NRRL 1]
MGDLCAMWDVAVGPNKTVIGHTEDTAGLASLIGTALALRNQTMLLNLHFQNLCPKVALYFDHLEISTARKLWLVAEGQVRRASVNSFGFGGRGGGGATPTAFWRSPLPRTRQCPRIASSTPHWCPQSLQRNPCGCLLVVKDAVEQEAAWVKKDEKESTDGETKKSSSLPSLTANSGSGSPLLTPGASDLESVGTVPPVQECFTGSKEDMVGVRVEEHGFFQWTFSQPRG